VVDAQGNVYATGITLSFVEKYSPTGQDLGKFATGISQPDGLAFDKSGDLYVSSLISNPVTEFSPTGAFIKTFVAFGILDEPAGMVFDKDGNLYVANSDAFTITKFSPTGADLGTFAIFPGAQFGPAQLAIDSSGNISASTFPNFGTAGVDEFSPAGSFLGLVTTNQNNQDWPSTVLTTFMW
jgi:sugar lactone lactonase YvrE